jgi:hypothetical protein
MPRLTQLPDIAQSLLEYLAIEGFAITPARKREIIARLRGLPSHAAAVRYDAKAAAQFFVYQLEFDDITADGVVLSKTLSMVPLWDFSARRDAKTYAKQDAALKQRPMVICDGNYENVQVIDEPPLDLDDAYCASEALGILNPDATNEDEAAESYQLLEPHLSSLRVAIEYVRSYARRAGPPEEKMTRLIVVARKNNANIAWRLYE